MNGEVYEKTPPKGCISEKTPVLLLAMEGRANRRGRAPRFSVADIDRLRNLRDRGYSYKEIADMEGAPHSTVYDALKSHGVRPAGMQSGRANSKPLSEKSEPLAGRSVSEREPRAEEAGGHPADPRTDE